MSNKGREQNMTNFILKKDNYFRKHEANLFNNFRKADKKA